MRVLLCIGIGALSCSLLRAQESGKNHSIVLVVQDQTGAVIPDAQVQLRPSSNTPGTYLKTNANGNLRLDLSPGNYDLTVTSPGFIPSTQRLQIQTATSDTETIRIVLMIGGCPPGCHVVTVGEPSPASSPTLPAAAPQAPDCSVRDLDVNLFPQLAPPTQSDAHWLAIDIRNREQTACLLIDLAILFPEQGYGFAYEGYRYPEDSSPGALAFRKKSQQLGPGEIVHLLLAWSSAAAAVDGLAMDNCTEHDSLKLTRSSPGPAELFLEIRHFSMKICGSWRSSLRQGPYVPGEPIEKQFLDRFHLKQSDFAPRIAPESADTTPVANRLATLRSLSAVEYLKGTFESGQSGYFELFLKLSSQAVSSCPFESLRKREADGETVIYMNRCDNRQVQQRPGTRTTRLLIRDLGLLPARTGRVEYDALTEILRGDRPALEQARLELSVRDPNKPMLPAIDTSTPACIVSQLRLKMPPVKLGQHWSMPRTYPPLGEEWYDGKVFEVTNTSKDTCMLGGTPELKFLNAPEVTTGGLLPPVCRNCGTPLFQPRESRWIMLKPDDSAYFIVVRHLLDRNYWALCTVMGGIDMPLGSDPPMRLPFEAGFCGQARVSAWRARPYDGDPMNIRYDREENQREQQRLAAGEPLPKEWVEQISADTDRPVVFRRGPVTWGLSTKPVSYGEPLPVLLWLYNSTDEPQSVMTCQGIDWFWLSEINVFDSAGHRVLSNAEQEDRKAGRSENARIFVCARNFPINIQPHTVVHGSFSKIEHDFARDLQSHYSLPPGRYFIVPSQENQGTQPTQNLSDFTNALSVVVQEP